MQRHPTLSRMAEVTGKSTATIHRWQKTNPGLYRAVVEYVARLEKEKEK